MPRIIPTNWETQVKIFKKFGAEFIREKGDHMIFRYQGALRPVVIPRYKEIPVTIIMNNMKVVSMSREEYFELLRES